MNQFFYTRKSESGTDVRDSFNINKVIRSLSNEDGTVLVLLDDLH
jgi:translation initiation factor RLI1